MCCVLICCRAPIVPNLCACFAHHFQKGHDGGLCVDELMRVIRSVDSTTTENERADDQYGTLRRAVENGGGENNLFAAGDCCCLTWPKRESDHWFQVRLWRQARAMGSYAAKCMTNSVDELGSGGAFDLFVHATQFFGRKVRGTQVSKSGVVRNPQGYIIDAAHTTSKTNVVISKLST